MNSINDLPYKSIVFHHFGTSKDRPVTCRLLDTSDITAEAANAFMSQFAGLELIKDIFKQGEHGHVELFRQTVRTLTERRKNIAPLVPTTSRKNLILKGPSSVGKTAVAQAIAIKMTVDDIAPKNRIVFFNSLDLRGEYVGETNVVINKLMECVRGGVLILDEIDALAPVEGGTSFDAEARNHLNVMMEIENNAGTIVIATGYPDGVERLFAAQPGLGTRFASVYAIPHYDDRQIASVLKLKIKNEGLTLAQDTEDHAIQQLCAARHFLGDKFGNGRMIEKFVYDMIAAHAIKYTPTVLRRITKKGGRLPKSFMTIQSDSVPVFVKDQRIFVVREGLPSLIQDKILRLV